jgi:hypothetical protein
MAFMWQYQVKAHVPPAQFADDWVEVPSLNKWMGESPDIRFRKLFLLPAIAAGSFFLGREINSPDKWFGELPDIYFPKPVLSKAIQSGSFSLQLTTEQFPKVYRPPRLQFIVQKRRAIF